MNNIHRLNFKISSPVDLSAAYTQLQQEDPRRGSLLGFTWSVPAEDVCMQMKAIHGKKFKAKKRDITHIKMVMN